MTQLKMGRRTLLLLYFIMCRRRANTYASSSVDLRLRSLRCQSYCPQSLLELRRKHSREKLAMVFLLLSAVCASFHAEPSVLVKRRSLHFWQFIVKRTFSAGDWYEKFRMSKETFDYLRRKLQLEMEKKENSRCSAIPV